MASSSAPTRKLRCLFSACRTRRCSSCLSARVGFPGLRPRLALRSSARVATGHLLFGCPASSVGRRRRNRFVPALVFDGPLRRRPVQSFRGPFSHARRAFWGLGRVAYARRLRRLRPAFPPGTLLGDGSWPPGRLDCQQPRFVARRTYQEPTNRKADETYGGSSPGQLIDPDHERDEPDRKPHVRPPLGFRGGRSFGGTQLMLFERFTDSARRAVVSAQEVALRMNHRFLSPTHVLLGVLHQNESAAAAVLAEFGVTFDVVADAYLAEVGRGSTPPGPNEKPKFTPNAKQAMEASLKKALRLSHAFISCEHLVLAILEVDDETRALVASVADVAELEKAITRALAQSPDPQQGRAPSEAAQTSDAAPGQAAAPRRGKGLLDQYTKDLTAMAREGKLDPVVGRQSEIEQVCQILGRRMKNNPILLGDPGVGKTAIVEGLAQ